MSRLVAVLRPEPGNSATVARAQALGLEALALPLFAVESLPWVVPNPAGFDALVLTSANSVRAAGPGLDRLSALPVLAVGSATAAAARAAGFDVMTVGTTDAAALLAAAGAAGMQRVLHLGGRESMVSIGGIVAESLAVYASNSVSVPVPMLARLIDGIALLHSPRAGQRLAALIDIAGLPRARIMIAALSEAVATAAGAGWQAAIIAAHPADDALLAQVAAIARHD
ncbi:uroporphyrinogen-III synthase [Sphingomonas sp. 28-63-12]|uniref:uroporphyrinogen-III synthase n=1 Tax=Sphingomonas sp. 28-63-12 TaxID=1970434 RepID=UPI000BD3623E|nr:MAG: uroporphyrinogen-III synthase [Sphingomonas sp. 28-63-12]